MNAKQLRKKLKSIESSSQNEVTTFIKPLIDTAVWSELMLSYFGNDNYCSSTFLSQILIAENYKNIETAIKLKKAFNHPSHWQSFKLLKQSKISKFRFLYKELLFVKKNQNYWNELADYYYKEIAKYSCEEIIIHFTSYFQKFKNYSKKTPNNRTIITSYEAILIRLLDLFLVQKNNKNNKKDNKYSLQEFNDLLKKELPPIKPNTDIFPKEKISKQKKHFRELIEFFFAKYDNNYQLDKYLSGFAEFEIIDDLEADLKTNKISVLYRQTLEKGTYEENYLLSSSFSKIKSQIETKKDFWDKEFVLKKISSLAYFDFYSIPVKITYKNHTIDIEKVVEVLQTFSVKFFPQCRNFYGNKTENFVMKRTLKKEFISLFIPNYICGFKKENLISKIAKYFNYSVDESTIIVDFLTIKSSDYKQNTEIDLNPFLQINDTIYWLSAFLKDRKWENLLHRKLWREKLINQQETALETEKKLALYFIAAGFETLYSYPYQWQTNKGEIDVLAYKDKTLFVIELKNTIVFEEMLVNKNYESRIFQSKASNQLQRAINYINGNFNVLKEKLSISCSFEELDIVTMIVSNSFQGDNLYYKNTHLKISFFELVVILKNDLYKVLINKTGKLLLNSDLELPVNFLNEISNRNNPYQKNGNKEVTKESTNLWKDTENCTPLDIVNAIKKNKVFKHLGEHRKYPIEEIELREYDFSHRYLD